MVGTIGSPIFSIEKRPREEDLFARRNKNVLYAFRPHDPSARDKVSLGVKIYILTTIIDRVPIQNIITHTGQFAQNPGIVETGGASRARNCNRNNLVLRLHFKSSVLKVVKEWCQNLVLTPFPPFSRRQSAADDILLQLS